MKYPVFFIALAFLSGCGLIRNQLPGRYSANDYVKVGKLLPTVNTPYIIDLRSDSKRLVFIGCNHSNDPDDPQFKIIENYFTACNPQMAFNEGGQIPDTLRFSTQKAAILQKGETGLLKYLCDRAAIKMQNADLPDSTEFSIILKKYPKDDLFLYYVMERLVIPYLNRAYGDRPFEALYDLAIDKWFVQQGFPLSEKERSYTYFRQLYQKKIGHPFVLEINEYNFEQFDYTNAHCKYCAIGRASKMLRDSMLLNKIDAALDTYDRVFVTFGQGHALAVEPALKKIINRKR